MKVRSKGDEAKQKKKRKGRKFVMKGEVKR